MDVQSKQQGVKGLTRWRGRCSARRGGSSPWPRREGRRAGQLTKLDKTGELLGDMLSDSFAEMQKAASMASALVLFFSTSCANFWSVHSCANFWSVHAQN